MTARRLSFSLRTLLLLVAACGIGMGWLAHELRLVSARKEFLANVRARSCYSITANDASSALGLPCPGLPEQPLLGRLLCDEWIALIYLHPEFSSAEDFAEATRLFPEAHVVGTAVDLSSTPEWFHQYGRTTGLNAFTGTAYEPDMYPER